MIERRRSGTSRLRRLRRFVDILAVWLIDAVRLIQATTLVSALVTGWAPLAVFLCDEMALTELFITPIAPEHFG